MRLASNDDYPPIRDVEGYPSWRVALKVWADEVLKLVFEIEAWLGLLRSTWRDSEDRERYNILIHENFRRIDIATDFGREILMHPVLKKAWNERMYRRRQQQQREPQQREQEQRLQRLREQQERKQSIASSSAKANASGSGGGGGGGSGAGPSHGEGGSGPASSKKKGKKKKKDKKGKAKESQ